LTASDTLVTQEAGLASITKRASGWFVQIRRKGYQPEYKSLPTRAEAERWARDREGQIDRGNRPIDLRALRNVTLADLIRRYLVEITPSKRSAESERLRMEKMLAAPVCELALSDLKPCNLAAYRDCRLEQVKPGTIARELSLIHDVIEVAWRNGDMTYPPTRYPKSVGHALTMPGIDV
jgi:hypothetical protein